MYLYYLNHYTFVVLLHLHCSAVVLLRSVLYEAQLLKNGIKKRMVDIKSVKLTSIIYKFESKYYAIIEILVNYVKRCSKGVEV